MRLIDADYLIQKVKEEKDKRHLDKDDASLLHFFIECYAQTVDAVPVIRCKDCKHWDKPYGWNGWCDKHSILAEADDFCSLAERKEE